MSAASPDASYARAEFHRGALYAVIAYTLWGLLPAYWKALGATDVTLVLAARVLGSVVTMGAIVLITGRGPAVVAVLGDVRRLGVLAATTTLIAANWGVFIYSVQAGRLVEASLGYYMNPLMYAAMGALLLGERLSRRAGVALAVAAAAPAVLIAAEGTVPLIALALSTTFAGYGLLRKRAPVDPATGLLIETLIAAPFAAAWWLSRPAGEVPADAASIALLLGAGPVTAAPLVAFAAAAKRMPLSTIGFFQYLAPTLQAGLAVLAYGEPLSPARIAALGAVLTAVAVFTWPRSR